MGVRGWVCTVGCEQVCARGVRTNGRVWMGVHTGVHGWVCTAGCAQSGVHRWACMDESVCMGVHGWVCSQGCARMSLHRRVCTGGVHGWVCTERRAWMSLHRGVRVDGCAQTGVQGGVRTDRCAQRGVHGWVCRASRARAVPRSTTSAARSIRASFAVGRRSNGPKSPQFDGFHGNPHSEQPERRARIRAAKRRARGKQRGVRAWGWARGGDGVRAGRAWAVQGVCDGAVRVHTARTPPSPPPPTPPPPRAVPRVFPLCVPRWGTGCSWPPPAPPSQELPGPVRAAGLPGWGGHRTTGTNRFRCARCAVSCGGRTQPDPPPGVTQRRGGVLSRSPLPKPPERCTGGGGKGVSKSPLRTDAPGRDTRRTEPPPHRRDPPQPPAVGDAVPELPDTRVT